MTGRIEHFESLGYRFRLAGDQVKVRAPRPLLEPQRIAEVREHKSEILAELRLRNFIDLVRAEAAIHYARLLHRDEVADALDEADRLSLLETALPGRQRWAALLAYRLTHPGRPGVETRP